MSHFLQRGPRRIIIEKRAIVENDKTVKWYCSFLQDLLSTLSLLEWAFLPLHWLEKKLKIVRELARCPSNWWTLLNQGVGGKHDILSRWFLSIELGNPGAVRSDLMALPPLELFINTCVCSVLGRRVIHSLGCSACLLSRRLRLGVSQAVWWWFMERRSHRHRAKCPCYLHPVVESNPRDWQAETLFGPPSGLMVFETRLNPPRRYWIRLRRGGALLSRAWSIRCLGIRFLKLSPTERPKCASNPVVSTKKLDLAKFRLNFSEQPFIASDTQLLN